MFSITSGQSLALMTDLYELTMAQGYWKEKMDQDEAVFHLFFRKKPFNGSYAIASGLAGVVSFLQNFSFSQEDIFYLRSLKTVYQTPLFEEDFLSYLRTITFTCSLDALPEGQVVFPYEPILRVQGPIVQCQLLESALLTLVNFSTLIATKAARICQAAQGDEVIEFGLRRAQGIDGAMTATRASYLGGCRATSNTMAGKWLGIPVKGTHAHSWVMAFDDESEAFAAYARAMPDNAFFLVDTYHTLQGVQHAITASKKMGNKLLGIRLDSGDIAYLSKESRKLLDKAGFSEAKIIASNELDEYLIAELKAKGAQVDIWGVGTKLVTGYPQSAIDGVYKLSARRKKGEREWRSCYKISDDLGKRSYSGILQIRRYYTKEKSCCDVLYDVRKGFIPGKTLLDPFLQQDCHPVLGEKSVELLVPIFQEGALVYDLPSLQESQEFCRNQLASFAPSITAIDDPHHYSVSMG